MLHTFKALDLLIMMPQTNWEACVLENESEKYLLGWRNFSHWTSRESSSDN